MSALINKSVRVSLITGYTGGTIRAESPRALLIDFNGLEKWLPKSQCEIEDNEKEVIIDVPEWLQKAIEQELGVE